MMTKFGRLWLKSLVGSLVLHFKTLLHFWGETFRWAKVTNFSFSDENFARQSFAREVIVFLQVSKMRFRVKVEYNQCLEWGVVSSAKF